MSKGFFSSAQVRSVDHTARAARCGLCGQFKKCKNPKIQPSGKGKKKILVVGTAPSQKEDQLQEHFIGKSGQLLRYHFRKLKSNLDIDCIKTFALICGRQADEDPSDEQLFACRPNLIKTINEYDPNIIIPLGSVATKAVISIAWKENTGNAIRWFGQVIPCQKLNVWIIPTFHPISIIKDKNKVTEKMFSEHLKIALSKVGSRPWDIVPDYSKQVQIIHRPSKAAKIIRAMIDKGGKIAFDYETNCLKPEYPKSEIVSCSICFQGKKTIAYPWKNEAIDATSEILKTKMPKIAANLKFEERWTRNKLGHRVRSWWWDTMQAAHILDNRPATTGLKFQAFVQMGCPDYDDHIKPFLQKCNNLLNRIKELDINDLLLYNGIDSILEYNLAMIQIKKIKKMQKIFK